ncbi:hypothetical protein FRC02_008908 [Tulasnella sp. 418]|nr:hypothetical protein FRC02_008908 [Tulasnella sp. 418]
MDWFEGEPELWVAILTGKGRAFCAGMDLHTWKDDQKAGGTTNFDDQLKGDSKGVGSLSRRQCKKPIIAAVNGFAVGGGLEIVINCDIVIASQEARFGYPEAGVGVAVSAGGLPRLVKVSGHQLAAELLFTGRLISAEEARDRFKFVNSVVPATKVLGEALEWAKRITANSPDAVQSNKRGIIEAHNFGSVEDATRAHASSEETRNMFKGGNMLEGLLAFSKRRKPVWTSPKL